MEHTNHAIPPVTRLIEQPSVWSLNAADGCLRFSIADTLYKLLLIIQYALVEMLCESTYSVCAPYGQTFATVKSAGQARWKDNDV
jgi:hypothetical protein